MESFLRSYAQRPQAPSSTTSSLPTSHPPVPITPKQTITKMGSKDYAKDGPIRNKQQSIQKQEQIAEREEKRQVTNFANMDPQLPTDTSIFSPDPETATTTVFLAPSFSGKTTLIVNQLNQLSDADLDVYTTIVLFTESLSAVPLKHISSRIMNKMVIFDTFLPDYISYLKRTNTMTGNRYRYLILFDDMLQLRGETIVSMILTLRNSGVSTAIAIQYSKLLSPGQRQSIHDYYLINLRLEDLEYLLTGFIATHMRDRLNEEGDVKAYDYSIKKLAEATRRRLKYGILHFDQRHDKIYIYSSPRSNVT